MDISLASLLSSLFIFFSISFALSVLILSYRNLKTAWSASLESLAILFSIVISSSLSAYFFQTFFPFILGLCAYVTFIGLSREYKNYSSAGIYFLFVHFCVYISGFLWGLFYILTIEVSEYTRVLLLAGVPFVLVALPFSIIQLVEKYEVLCRHTWLRPRAVEGGRRQKYPKVSLHVPIHAEPPHIVIETLILLSQLEYPNFEVIVVDNNTDNEKLWKPVERACMALGPQFKFFHVNPLRGAKAGALNFALTKTDPQAEIVSLVDADYHARPDFLSKLIGHFDDPRIGFVQTPHDYRDFEHSAYLRMCYFEYKLFFHTVMVSMNERDAALTVGTMCLIRKQALIDAGGWSLWCVTEDSELSIRIHALGYSSVYIPESFGKGLIPTEFAGYKKQRYRWIAGPIQEFKRHFAMLSPVPVRKTKLSFFQRLHHFNHGLVGVYGAIETAFIPLLLVVVASMVYHAEQVPVPLSLWIGISILSVCGLYLTWLLHRVALQATLSEILGALFAGQALAHVTALSSLRTLLRSKTPWHRTNKFETTSSFWHAIASSESELGIGIFLFGCIVLALLYMPYQGLLLMILLGLLYKALAYLATPVFALLGAYEAMRREESPARSDFRWSAATISIVVVLVGSAGLAYLTPASKRHFDYNFLPSDAHRPAQMSAPKGPIVFFRNVG